MGKWSTYNASIQSLTVGSYSLIYTYIHPLITAAAMQDANLSTRSNLGISVLPKDRGSTPLHP